MNLSNITLKRINGDLKKFSDENPKYVDVFPNIDNILEINFLLYGREDSNFKGGQYIGKIIHSPEYPCKAPDYYVFTPNGRFEVGKKICLTNSSYHQINWAPAAWNLITLLEGFSSVWHSEINEDKIGISHITNCDPIIINNYASNSVEWNIKNMNSIYQSFPKIIKENNMLSV